MALFAKDPQTIIQEAEDFMLQNTVINSTSPGSKFASLLQIMKKLLDDAYKTFDFNTAITLIYGARGRFLDFLGDVFGVQRIDANTAFINKDHKVVKFYTTRDSFGDIQSDIVIPSGTKVWANTDSDPINYITTEDLTLPNVASESYVSVKAILPGEVSNMQAGMLSNHSLGLDDLFVVNTNAITTGKDIETDENFRYRIINQKLVGASANQTALRIAALKVPGVADVLIFDRHFGIGTTAVMIKSVDPIVSDELLARVQSELDSVKGSGIKTMAIKPQYLYMRFVISLGFKENTSELDKTNARSASITAINDYINNLDMGESFNVNILADLIISAHPKIKTIGKPNKFIDNIYVKKNLTEVEVIENYVPTEYQKLIVSNESNNIVFN